MSAPERGVAMDAAELHAFMTEAFDRVYSMYTKHKTDKVTMRMAADMVAVDRVGEAVKIRGWVG